MALLVGFDQTGLPTRTADELENILAAIQTWVGKQEGLNAAFDSRQAGLEGKLDAAVPTGGIMEWPTTTAPAGYLLCNGAAVDRVTYGALFGVIGVSFGAGNGSTTFNVPDCRGRVGLGLAASGTGSTLGGTGGSLDHTHTGPSHTHTGATGAASPGTNSQGNHTHTMSGSTATEGTHVHAVSGTTSGPTGTSTQQNGAGASFTVANDTHTHTNTFNTGAGQDHSHGAGTLATSNTGAHTHTVDSHTHTISADGTGATGAANMAFIALPRIIKT